MERAPRPVTIHTFTVASGTEAGVLAIEVSCSAGTYVRTLAAERSDVYGLRLYVESENRGARSTYLAMGMEETNYVLCEEMTRKR